ncbi:hypothetical protein E2C01_092922 [Portunus trituberculatus]|uniref:Secreted protein n=1 Tax=Portunus trituberculatus TaxID=210409 RepID=A0A5B7JNG3_PORTR|nr:hypothetical protein [Portunus trituberculatus]
MEARHFLEFLLLLAADAKTTGVHGREFYGAAKTSGQSLGGWLWREAAAPRRWQGGGSGGGSMIAVMLWRRWRRRRAVTSG